jgi:O-antigen/teichoic acid export membrane protein
LDLSKYSLKLFGKDLTELLLHAKNYISAEFLTKGLAFLTLPIFTMLMSPDEYGVMSVFSSFTGILSIIFGLGIRGAISRYYYEEQQDFFDYFSSNIWFVLFISCLLTILAIIFQNQLQSFLNIPKGMIYISFGIVIPQVIFQLYKAYLQAAQKSKKIAYLSVINAVISTGLAIAIMYQMADERYYAKAFGQGIGILIIFFLTVWFLKKEVTFNIKKEHLKYSLVFGFPIVIHLLSQNILNTFDQLIINQISGNYEAGLYSVAYKIGMVQNVISMAILKSWTPIFYKKMNNEKYIDINYLARKYAVIILVVATLLILFSKEAITTLVDPKYYQALPIIPIIIVSYYFFFLYTIYVGYAFYFKETKNIALITIVAGAINIILNYLLIPKYGYIFAAWTTLISYFVLFVLHYSNVRWVLKPNKITNVKIFILPVIILIIVGLTHYYITQSGLGILSSLIFRLSIIASVMYYSYKQLKD